MDKRLNLSVSITAANTSSIQTLITKLTALEAVVKRLIPLIESLKDAIKDLGTASATAATHVADLAAAVTSANRRAAAGARSFAAYTASLHSFTTAARAAAAAGNAVGSAGAGTRGGGSGGGGGGGGGSRGSFGGAESAWIKLGHMSGRTLEHMRKNLFYFHMWATQSLRSFANRVATTFNQFHYNATRAFLVLSGLGVASLTAVARAGVDMNVTLERSGRAFTKILGSPKSSKALVSALKEEAKVSALTFKELLPLAQSVAAAYGPEGIGKVIPTIRAFGDTAVTLGADSGAVDRALIGFRQLITSTKPMAEELRQITENLPGFNAKEALEAAFGTSSTEVLGRAGVTGRQVGEVVVKAMQESFGGAQAEAAKTLPVLMSNITDAFDMFAATLTTTFTPQLTKAASLFYKFLNDLPNNKELMNALATPFEVFGQILVELLKNLPKFAKFLKSFLTTDNIIRFFANLAGTARAVYVELKRIFGIATQGNSLNQVVKDLGAMFTFLLDVLLRVASGVAALFAAITRRMKTGNFEEAFNRLFNAVGKSLKTMEQTAEQLIPAIWGLRDAIRNLIIVMAGSALLGTAMQYAKVFKELTASITAGRAVAAAAGVPTIIPGGGAPPPGTPPGTPPGPRLTVGGLAKGIGLGVGGAYLAHQLMGNTRIPDPDRRVNPNNGVGTTDNGRLNSRGRLPSDKGTGGGSSFWGDLTNTAVAGAMGASWNPYLGIALATGGAYNLSDKYLRDPVNKAAGQTGEVAFAVSQFGLGSGQGGASESVRKMKRMREIGDIARLPAMRRRRRFDPNDASLKKLEKEFEEIVKTSSNPHVRNLNLQTYANKLDKDGKLDQGPTSPAREALLDLYRGGYKNAPGAKGFLQNQGKYAQSAEEAMRKLLKNKEKAEEVKVKITPKKPVIPKFDMDKYEDFLKNKDAYIDFLIKQAELLVDRLPESQQALARITKITPLLNAKKDIMLRLANMNEKNSKEYWEGVEKAMNIEGQIQNYNLDFAKKRQENLKEQDQTQRKTFEAQLEYFKAKLENNPLIGRESRRGGEMNILKRQLQYLATPAIGETEEERYKRLTEFENVRGDFLGAATKNLPALLARHRFTGLMSASDAILNNPAAGSEALMQDTRMRYTPDGRLMPVGQSGGATMVVNFGDLNLLPFGEQALKDPTVRKTLHDALDAWLMQRTSQMGMMGRSR